MSHRVADGARLVDGLRDHPDYQKILSAYRKASVAQSCLADLREAGHMVGALRELLKSSRKRGSVQRAATETALLAQAVQLYARATHTAASKGDRGSIDIRPHLDPAQREDHHHLSHVRVYALAHVYPGKNIGGSAWHRGMCMLVETDHGWRVGFASNRTQIDAQTLQALERQIPVAGRVALAIFHKRTTALSSLLQASGAPLAAYEDALIDLAAIMGPDGARAAINGLIGGEASHWTGKRA
ncbi:hypothetical protein [Sphingobium yanoikuyae]|uniref:hypothetical protein n=1 Tax=Sphingobium yanoikuyae TaxID=13690 RepID=UPI000262BCDE|nr:hypothetical protein [Sphingobium yanoikuyae]